MKSVYALILPAIVIALHVTTLPAAPSGQRVNVLLVMADDLNTALSGYGHPQCRTPNLDRLAERGTTFSRAYTQFPLCGPSRASIMSGQYPLSNKITGNGRSLKSDLVTLPKCFRDAGYWTGRVSKIYHMGVPGNIFTGDNGADHAPSWVERYNVSAMETLTPGKAEDLMLEDSTSLYESLRPKWAAQRHKGGKFMIPAGNHQGSDFVVVEASVGDEALADGMAANKGVELLRERSAQPEPFFLGVGFVRPHVPLVAPLRSFDGYEAEEMRLAEKVDGDLNDIPSAAQRQTNANRYKLTEENQKKVLRGYYASVSYMDQQVGRLLDTLDELELTDRTIVVFLSDHGYHLGEHTMWQKMSLMEESIRVPLIMAAPGQKQANAHCSQLVELLDIFPTLAELAGLKTPLSLQGESFAGLLDDPTAPRRREDALIQVGGSFCLRTEKWAYMRYAGRKGQPPATMLYDMEADPRQFTNVAGRPEHAKLLKKLDARLNERIGAAGGK